MAPSRAAYSLLNLSARQASRLDVSHAVAVSTSSRIPIAARRCIHSTTTSLSVAQRIHSAAHPTLTCPSHYTPASCLPSHPLRCGSHPARSQYQTQTRSLSQTRKLSSSSSSTPPEGIPPDAGDAHAQERAEGLEAPDYLDEAERRIWGKLRESLEVTELDVKDVSGGCGTMYAIEIASPKFKGLPVIKQHRMVNQVLGEDIKGWHGVHLTTRASP